MQSTVLFDDIIFAFLAAGNDEFYFLCEKDLVKKINANKDTISEMGLSGYVCIPKKTKEFEKKIKENFVYEIADPKLAEKFFEASMHPDGDPFEKLIEENKLESTWSKNRKNLARNALINWLVKSNIDLQGQLLSPPITIQPTTRQAIPDEMASFVPVKCNTCSNNLGFAVSYFQTSIPCENLLMENQAKMEMKKLGYEEFHFLGKERKELIAACLCSRCKGVDLTWDFR